MLAPFCRPSARPRQVTLRRDGREDDARLTLEHGDGLPPYPGLRHRVTLLVEAPRRLPQILEHVDEVDDDQNGQGAGRRFGLDAGDLAALTVTRAARVLWWPGSPRSASAKIWAMTIAAASTRLAVVDDTDLGHAVAAPLLLPRPARSSYGGSWRGLASSSGCLSSSWPWP